MTSRNFNNTTASGTLSAPASTSSTTLATTGFLGYPTAPFTVTLDRNTVTEEVVLVTAAVGANLTVTRGYNGTAAQAHEAGGTVEHTAVALDFTEANAHINATANVHGTEGDLVGTEGSQTLLDKTLTSPLFEADVAMGDAVVAYVPEGAEARNLFRGMDPNGDDVAIIDSTGIVTVTGVHSTGNTETDGNHQVDGNLTVGGTAAFTGAVTVPVQSAAASPARKEYVDSVNTALDARLDTAEATLSAATAAATASVIAKRDSNGRLAVATPSATGDAATKGYADGLNTAMDTRVDVLEAAYTKGSSTGIITDASGQIVITHLLGATPSQVIFSLRTATVANVTHLVVTARTSTTFTVTAYNSTNGAVLGANGVNFDWVCFR